MLGEEAVMKPASIASFLRHFVCSAAALSLVACGSADFKNKNDKRDGAADEELAGETLGDCYSLGGGPGQTPHQGDIPVVIPGKPQPQPNPYVPPVVPVQPGKGQEPVPVVIPVHPGKGEVPVQPIPVTPGKPGKTPCNDHPGQNPGQHPCYDNCGKTPCDHGCGPTPCDHGCGSDPCDHGCGPIVIQPHPIVPGNCGKGGVICDDGGPVQQWPGQTTSGKPYDRGDIEACLNTFRNQGVNTKGQWAIDVRESKSVSVLSDTVIRDAGNTPSIVFIKAVSVLGRVSFELLNPNALYCIKSVSVLEEVNITSCHQANVVFGKDVNVLSRVGGQVLDCR
jgi:hypothetical protein